MFAKHLLSATGLAVALTVVISCQSRAPTPGSIEKTIDGYTFRDLNKNGKLDVYEDARQPVSARVNDLLSQMTLAEKLTLIHDSREGPATYQGQAGYIAGVPRLVMSTPSTSIRRRPGSKRR